MQSLYTMSGNVGTLTIQYSAANVNLAAYSGGFKRTWCENR